MKFKTKRKLIRGAKALSVALVWYSFGWWGSSIYHRLEEPAPTEDTIIVEEVPLTLDDHINNIVPDKLQDVCRALIWVESRGNASAVSSNGKYVGILQLGEVYVKECNRLQDTITFTLEDRYDSVKSLQMFTIIQNYHNPKHDLHRAIYLHNPTAGPEYRDRVLRKFKTIY